MKDIDLRDVRIPLGWWASMLGLAITATSTILWTYAGTSHVAAQALEKSVALEAKVQEEMMASSRHQEALEGIKRELSALRRELHLLRREVRSR